MDWQAIVQGLMFSSISELLAKGGDVLWLIFVTAVVLWTLIIERLCFFHLSLPRIISRLVAGAQMPYNHSNWHQRQIQNQHLSMISGLIGQHVPLIGTLISLCPLLGLLGTVSGMMQIFDVLAVTGTGNPKAMASGISQATIPTMAGMVVALSGLYFKAYFQKRTSRDMHRVRDLFTQRLLDDQALREAL